MVRTIASPIAMPVALLLIACSTSDDGVSPPDPRPIPPDGPNFSVSPIPVERIARITLLGFNNNVFPTSHTYWLTCDDFVLLQTDRPCVREQLPIRAPAAGVVRDLNSVPDGHINLEGPPGLFMRFGHVTPAAGLVVGSRVEAGDVIATMFETHIFDFGVWNFGVSNRFVAASRYNDHYVHGQHPIAQFPEPLRGQLIERTQGIGAGLGRLDWDVEGTAAGFWYIRGSPSDGTPHHRDNNHMLLFLARYQERPETRILTVGQRWPEQPQRMLAVDSMGPSWESITPASGPVSLRLYNLAPDARPNYAWPGGSLRLHLFHRDTLRIEWFDTHDPVPDFTAGARIYNR